MNKNGDVRDRMLRFAVGLYDPAVCRVPGAGSKSGVPVPIVLGNSSRSSRLETKLLRKMTRAAEQLFFCKIDNQDELGFGIGGSVRC